MSLPPDLFGTLAAILTTGCWLPQAVKIIRTKDTKAISMLTYSAFALGVLCWLIYGIQLNSWPMIGANTITLALVLVILALKVRYDINHKD